MLTPEMLLLLTLLAPMPAGQTLPTDPLQACATRAMRGDFGRLKPWQELGYRQALATGATVQGSAWVTSYYPWEHDGHRTRSGRKPSHRSAAVQSRDFKRQVFRFCWTGAYGLRIVEDSGANRNTRYARHKGADAWLDYYWQTRHDRNPVTAYAIFGDSKRRPANDVERGLTR
jgi:hypothetical protein